ncbi:protein of unknown function DUF364 [Methanolacinia petrolearia DSM 11571]|uniref:Heavy-metal chelation domain-containing protein n=1 Tax=Methanolacinia petrolearia (strain DSM 11571 / OCM 486 / SEBR 4847) TaxID=679926 RepID=E1REE3_METP4|nr:DUF364 domain-containing protein [Methanolacinia petrolearia]ADN37186.1 protein of unknown function DUF364 [Methanolacinia petrolearia DSM 11571]
MSKWEIYDALIEGIPDDVIVGDVVIGAELTYVQIDGGGGVAPYRPYWQRAPQYTGNKIGKPLKEVAELVKSWNFIEASVGNAAIVAWYNHPENAQKNGVEIPKPGRVEGRLKDPFINSQNEIRGKKVCVVGHFPFIEGLFEPVCDLSVVEWDPGPGDYPYNACDFLLPECDFAFITCAAIGDKSLPRLLELSENAEKVAIVGPGTPLAPQFFDFGVGDLSGFVINDPEMAKRIASGAEFQRIYAAGTKVNLLASSSKR